MKNLSMAVDTEPFPINMVSMCLYPLLIDEDCTKETLLNLYKALFAESRKLNQLISDMGKVKLDQVATT
jgi:hypothetical protein